MRFTCDRGARLLVTDVSSRMSTTVFGLNRISAILPLVLAVSVGCSGSASKSAGEGSSGETLGAEATGLRLDSLRAEVRALIGDVACQRVEQCRAIPFGSKPCGGPRAYLVYSTATTDTMEVVATVAEYTKLDEALNRDLGRISDCQAVAEPKVGCVDSRCIAVE